MKKQLFSIAIHMSNVTFNVDLKKNPLLILAWEESFSFFHIISMKSI